MRRTRPALVLAFLLTFALTLAPLFPAFGDEAAEPAAEDPVVGQLDLPESSTPQEELPLSLRDAVAMGIENNLNIQVDRFSPLIADEDSAIAWSAYDPVGSGSFTYFSNYDPASPNRFAVFSDPPGDPNELVRVVDRGGAGQLAVQGLVPYLGASLGLTFDLDETRSSNPISSWTPEYNSNLGVTASIPLLKNLIWNEPWTLVKSSEVVYEASVEVFRASLMDVVQTIENAYWHLVAMAEQAGVARKSLQTAESLLDQVKTQYDVGVVSKVQVVEAEAGVAERQVDVIRQDNFYQTAQDLLIDAVLGPHLTASSQFQIQPTDDPADYVEYEIDVEEASQNAFSNRPELQAALKEIERREIQLKFARNQWLPEFNIEGGYSVSGRRGEGADETIDDSGDGVGDTFSDWGTGHGGKAFNIRGVLRVPLGNIRGRHGLSRAKLELRRAKTRELQLRQSIILEVRNGARNLNSAQQGILAAERRRLAAAEQLRAERIRLEYGEATPFDVLLRDRDLVDAESQQIGALQLYRTSQVDLQRAQGTILQTHNIVVEEASTLR
jgi:outer membrane protein TolC